MEDPPLNPSQQVERIREILIGRQLHQVEDRLRALEDAVASKGDQMGQDVAKHVQEAQSSVLSETRQLRRQIQQESQLRDEQLRQLSSQLANTNKQLQAASAGLQEHDGQFQKRLSTHLENISSAMAARIDARIREILQHLQTELTQWKHQVDRDLQSVRNESISRAELKNRLSKMASAAMEDDPPPSDGFLL